MKWWSRRVTLPHQLACRASALLVCHDPELKSEIRNSKSERSPKSETRNSTPRESDTFARSVFGFHSAFGLISDWRSWQAASVLPGVSGVLETLPRADAQPGEKSEIRRRKSERSPNLELRNRQCERYSIRSFGFLSGFGFRPSDFRTGAAAGNRTRTSSVAGRHSGC